ncbi:mercuric transport protein [Caenimonas sedimenti]|uniref:Mercuric transport protein MerT n=1 Tax=Caenimonas sedimenti TaxID=2596921 RepID=A0A562ZIM0_9BURK|nr:mercuric transporter MerT family protein [Caenimonas sedimenti]TWO68044.1 mercuric transport protein [Caenimonas sedimenti]
MNVQTPPSEDAPRSSSIALGAAAVASFLASACCVAPLAFVLVGVSGAWIGQLAAFEPYQPIFLAVAALALILAWRKIWRAQDCGDGRLCAAPAGKRAQKFTFLLVAGLLAIVLGFPFAAPLFY